MVETADEVEKNNTCWTLMGNKNEQDMLDTAIEVRTKKRSGYCS